MDLDCGIKVWYYKPTFWVRLINFLFSLILVIFLFDSCIKLSDDFFKLSISKWPLVLTCFLAISQLVASLSFIIAYFKVLPEYQIPIVFTTIGAVLTYIILFVAFLFACGTSSASQSAQITLKKYLSAHYDDKIVIDFLSKHNSNYTKGAELDSVLIHYVNQRTYNIGFPLFILSTIWTILTTIVYYALFYSGKASELVASEKNDEMEEPLNKNNKL